ncbi:tRNA uracil 4-sulfurtransferase ThiI [Massiliimalia massiliensis]|uniref:tRNA uracil 4-sulfurtransferase ThiI n=1 Tax=Massiliimalia massiliensis TaxID=1852384 RepID=UPI0009863559|nr:tRNA uracil 4-sulfurtransferase ThiI [Massiliimalia massiliensis]
MKQEVIMIKLGEIALKGLNRKTFEDTLVKNIKWRLRGVGKFAVTRAQSTMYIEPKEDDIDFDEAADHLSNVFGIAAFTRALVTEKKLEAIKADAVEYMRDVLPYAKTFKVTAKRADKSFPLTSPQIQQELGGTLLDAYPHLKVDVHNPEVTVTIEIRDFGAYIHGKQIPGAGGMPVGSSGKAMVLISGGIDSPVAAYMMAKRGLILHAVHFVSPPYTSDRARQKVEDLCEIVSRYAGRIYFHCVPFTKIQEAIKTHCPEEFFTIIMRRLMMEIAIRISEENDLKALITGESLAQVASQTIGAIAATDDVCTMPVFRPLIGMDKNEIIEIARKIGTFETSILPFEDCCTVFTPKHPKTRPAVEQVRAAQAAFDFAPLVEEAVRETEVKTIAAL